MPLVNQSTPAPSLILVLEPHLVGPRRNRIRQRLEELGLAVRVVPGGVQEYLEATGDALPALSLAPDGWPGVVRVISFATEYPHAAHGTGDLPTVAASVVEFGPPEQRVSVGGGHFALMAGPCAIETPARALQLAQAVRAAGAQAFRGGAYKPRTSPYAFQGLAESGLEILAEVRARTGLPIVTEVLDTADIAQVAEIADLLQVGSRNMQNYALLKQLARVRKPVLLKRGYASTVRELLLAAEYLLCGGNHQVILCERGLRSAAGEEGVVLDLGVIPALRRCTHLPVVVDPSHGSARSDRVPALARAAVAAGADGLLIEVHDDPLQALSDGRQALTPEAFRQLAREVDAVRRALRPE